MAIDTIQQSFSGGEWAPKLDGRSDLEKYYTAARNMQNMIPTRYGPAERRPGLQFVAEVRDSSKATRILPFKFSTVQAYIEEFGDEYIRFYKDRGQIQSGVGTEDISALDNVIAHWKLNDDLDDTVVVDADGATHNGVASANTSILSVAGKVNDCFDLDGTYAVSMTDHNDFSFTDNADDSAFSIFAWVYATPQGNPQTILSKWDETTGAEIKEWRFSLDSNNKLQLEINDDTVDLTGDIVCQYILDENAANTTVLDNTANNHDGTTTTDNTEDLTDTGKIGACLNFVGTNGITITNDHADLSFGDSANDSDFSLAAWIYVTSHTDEQDIFTKWGTVLREWNLLLDSSEKLSLGLYDESENAAVSMKTDDTLTAGWHFVAATYEDGVGADADAGERITLYVDGAVVASTAGKSGGVYVAMEDTAEKVMIGARVPATPAKFFQDKIDNVMLFSKLLSLAEVQALYNNGIGTESLAVGATSFAVSDDALTRGWRFVAATYSAPADETAAADGIILYVDGAAVNSSATNAIGYTAMQNGAAIPRIGAQEGIDGNISNIWGDKIDDVALFGDVLTPAEIAALYTTGAYEISSPYLEDDLFGLQRIQSADVMFGFHPDYNPRKLSRHAHDDWTLESIAFDWPPFTTENITDTTITPSGTVGTIELTATNPIFTSDHIGSFWLIRHNRTNNQLEKKLTDIATLIVLGDAADSYAAEGVTDILVDVKGTFRLRTSGIWGGTVVLERSYDGQLVLVLDAAPAGGAWAANDIITGSTSGDTCIIVSATDTTHYVIKQLSGSFTDGEILMNQSGNARNTAATWPRYEGWHILEPFQSTQDQNFNAPGEETLGDAYIRARRTVDDADNDPTVILSCERFYHYGIAEIIGFTSATSVTATTIRTLGSTAATKLWSEGAWSDERGYPSAGTFHEERLMLGGTVFEPHRLDGSKTDEWENFRSDSVLDDDSISYSLASNEVNAIRWLISKEILLMGTSGAEWKLGSFDTGEPLTPGNPTIPRTQTTYGSRDIQAIMLANVVLFVQAEGRVVRGAQFVFEKGESGGYDAPDYTTLAEHITESGIVSMAYQQQPEPVLWCVLNNGKAIGMTFEPGQKIWGWFPMVTEGEFEDVAVIPGVSEDEVWFVVKRQINGATKRYVEYMKPRNWGDDQKDAFFVDSGLTFDGGDAVTITGITQADPAVVTMDTYPTDGDGNDLEDGDQVRIRYVGGMLEVNNMVFTVSNPNTTARTFELRDKLDTVDIDSTTFTAFSASITGDTTYDSEDVTNVSGADIAKLAIRAPVTGTGIPSDSIVTEIGGDRFTVSNKATKTGTITITITGKIEQVDNTFSGLGHLEGETVQVLGDGTVHEEVVVSSATVGLTDYFNKVHIGKRYKSKLQPMKLEIPLGGGTTRAKTKKIGSIIFSFHKSLGCTFGTTVATETITFRSTVDAMGEAVPLFTGEKEQTFTGGYELNGDIFVEQSEPLPLTVRSISPRLQLFE